jgi:hypothetical protein
MKSGDHPNIAQVHGLEESPSTTALVMELVDGDDLSRRIARGAIPLEEALDIAEQMCRRLHGPERVTTPLQAENLPKAKASDNNRGDATCVAQLSPCPFKQPRCREAGCSRTDAIRIDPVVRWVSPCSRAGIRIVRVAGKAEALVD